MMPKSIDLLYVENENLKKEISKLKEQLRKIDIEGWKGKDRPSITKVGTDWEIVEHRKDKSSGEIGKIKHTVSEEKVLILWKMIQNEAEVNQSVVSRRLWHDIILKYNLSIEIEEFNGGKNRSSIYFPLFYYPIKVLEEKGLIRYGGRGKITRLVP